MWRSFSWRWYALALAVFVGRLLFGLSSKFFTEDETQIYLIGLRSYATRSWPHFGPDVVWTKSEIPGALQALLISGPLAVLPIPESPVVLLNILSFCALAALAWYIAARVPSVPRWLIGIWVMTAPWTLHFSTHVINPSYVLPGAILFFLGFFEAVPSLAVGLISPPVAFAMMGGALTWTFQIHMSWSLLLPYLAVAWLSRRGDGIRRLAVYALAGAGGAAVPGVLLVPTLYSYGWLGGLGGTLRNIRFHFVGPQVIVITLARVFSFASLEINRFIATDDAKRVLFAQRHLWLAPLAAVVWLAGLAQPVWMLVAWFQTRRVAAWLPLRRLVVWTVLLIYLSYWFVLEPPQAHAIYLAAPIAFVFAAHCWSLIDSPGWRRVAAGVVGANLAFHVLFAAVQAPVFSLYKNRHVVAQAIRIRQPEILGHRRAYAVEPGPTELRDALRPYDALRDLQLLDPAFSIGRFKTANWTFRLRNTNPRVAYRDVLYITTFRDQGGRPIEQRHEFIRDVFQPGAEQRLEVNDGFVTFPFGSATVEIAAAEALLPSDPNEATWLSAAEGRTK
jgi:hypothetical protein